MKGQSFAFLLSTRPQVPTFPTWMSIQLCKYQCYLVELVGLASKDIRCHKYGSYSSNISSHLVILFKNHTNSYISRAFSFTYSSSPYESQQRLSGAEARNGWEESVATSGSSGVMALKVVMNFEEFPKHHVPGSLWKKNEHERILQHGLIKSHKNQNEGAKQVTGC